MRVDQHGQLPVPLCFLGDVRVEREPADDEHVEADALHGFLRRFLHLLWSHCSVLRTNGHRHATRLAVRVRVLASGLEPASGMWLEPR